MTSQVDRVDDSLAQTPSAPIRRPRSRKTHFASTLRSGPGLVDGKRNAPPEPCVGHIGYGLGNDGKPIFGPT